MIAWFKDCWQEWIAQHQVRSIGNGIWCFTSGAWKDLLREPVYIVFWEEIRTYTAALSHGGSRMCESSGISQSSSTIKVSLHYNIKGNIHPLLSQIVLSLTLSLFLSLFFCSVELWRKCQVKLWKAQRVLWCRCIWINTVWNASGVSRHQNSYFIFKKA